MWGALVLTQPPVCSVHVSPAPGLPKPVLLELPVRARLRPSLCLSSWERSSLSP